MTATTKLPSYSRNTRRYRRLRSFLDRLRADCGSEPIAWIALPTLAVLGRPRALERHPPHRVRPEQIAGAARAPARPGFAGVVGTRRVPLPRLHRQPASRARARVGAVRPRGDAGTRCKSSPTPTGLEELAAGAEELAERFIVAAKGERFRLPLSPKRVYRQLFSCAHAFAHFEAALRAVAPRAAVVATTHSAHARALVLAAREAGIATIYIPHAPVISDARLVDLPVDYAGLRGPAEVDHYEALGAPGERLAVVGNAALGEQGPGPSEAAPARAGAGHRRGRSRGLRATIELAHSVLGERCVLSPHPRTDHDSLRELMPDGWRLWDGTHPRPAPAGSTGPRAELERGRARGPQARHPDDRACVPEGGAQLPVPPRSASAVRLGHRAAARGSAARQEAPPMALAPQAARRMVREVGLGYRRDGGHGGGGTARAGGQHGSASRWADLGCLVVVGRTASARGAGRERDRRGPR